MQLSRSLILEVHLVPHGRAIHRGQSRRFGVGRVSAPFREVTFCASYKCHCFGVKGSRLSWFRPCSALSDLEHVIALATSPRCLGRPRHVQLLLLLGDVGKHRTKALVLDDGSLIDL